MEMSLPKFNIYKGRVVPNCFRSHANSWCPDYFEKKKNCLMPGLKSTFFDVILFLPENLRCHKFRLYRTLESSKRCITPGESIFLNFLILSIFFIQNKLQQRFKGTIGLKMIINNNNCRSRARARVCVCV